MRRDALLRMEENLAPLREEAEKVVPLFLPRERPESLTPPRYLAVDSPYKSPLFGNSLRGAEEAFPVESYKNHIAETCSGPGNAKRSTIRGDAATTGASARLNLGFPLRPSATAIFEKWSGEVADSHIWANSLAQAIELVHCIERSVELIRELRDETPLSGSPNLPGRTSGSGSAVMEAPRGILIHSYSFDAAGVCTAADIITPTAINQAAMERDLLITARSQEGADEEEMKLSLEMLVRAYDPCISCAVHMIRL